MENSQFWAHISICLRWKITPTLDHMLPNFRVSVPFRSVLRGGGLVRGTPVLSCDSSLLCPNTNAGGTEDCVSSVITYARSGDLIHQAC